MNLRKEKAFEEKREFNPLLWKIRKKLFGLNRYRFNSLLLMLAGMAYWVFQYKQQVNFPLEYIIPAVLIALALSIRVGLDWERAPILRFGKFSRTKGPGLFFTLPVIETIIGYIDSRVRVTDFSAEKVLTKDSVPVYIDAIIFWMVWDAGKATLEVENFQHAVSLSAKTALREITGKNSLARLLTDRDGIGKQLQKILDEKTNPWGITSLSVEIKDIVIPQKLEEAMSKEAQAEREKNARLILGQAEEDVATNYSLAAKKYENNATALQLRSLNLLIDALKKGGSMILLPSDVPTLMNKAEAAAIAKISKQNNTQPNTQQGE